MAAPQRRATSGLDGIVGVGASAGGLEALRVFVANLPVDLPHSVLVVLHTARTSPGALGDILDRSGTLPAAMARCGEPVRAGRVYVAGTVAADPMMRPTRSSNSNTASPWDRRPLPAAATAPG